MFGIFKKSKIVRKSDNLNDTTTKWFNGQKVKIKSGTSAPSTRRNQTRRPKTQHGLEKHLYLSHLLKKNKC